VQEFNQEEQIENSVPELKEKTDGIEILTKPTPNNPPWNSGMAFLVWFVSVGLILILPSLFILPYLVSKDIPLSGNPDLGKLIFADPQAIAISLGATMFAHLLTIILAWFIVTRFKTYSFTEMLGWRWGGFKFWHGLVILVAVYAVALTLANLLGTQENEMTKILASSRAAVFMVAILATFSAPIVEEVVYRGVLYSAFQRTFNPSIAVVSVTVLFAAVHVPQYLPDYATIISICFLSLIITLIRAKTDNLLPCIVFHTVFNGIQSVLLILEPYIPLPENLKAVPEKTSFIIHFLSYIPHFY
jgi:membrane protease YdiL (CAAX protease family)